jgi:hypothetical protein
LGKNLLLGTISIGIALLLTEAVLRLFYEVPPIWREPQNKHLESPLLGWVQVANSKSFSIDVFVGRLRRIWEPTGPGCLWWTWRPPTSRPASAETTRSSPTTCIPTPRG